MQRENDFLYKGLADMLRSQIYSNLIRPGTLLLSENEMCRKYNVSRTSVRKALEILLEENLIVKKHGKGTMVSPDFKPGDTDSNTLIILAPYPSNYVSKGLPILIRLFQERYPEMKARAISVPFEDELFLENLLQFGILPDIILMSERYFQHAGHHMFCQLDDMVGEDHGIPQTLLEAFRRDGRLYALPVTYSPVYLAYNRDLLAAYDVAPPRSSWTLEQLLETSEKLTIDSDGNTLKEIYGMAVNNELNRWLPFLANRLSGPADAAKSGAPAGDGKWTQFREVLQFLQEALYIRQVSPIYSVGDSLISQELFEKGHVAMIPTTTLAFFANPSRFGMAALPFGVNRSHLLISNAMLVTQFSKRQELAKLFLSLSLEREVQREVAASTGLLAVSTAVNRDILQKSQLEALGLTEEALAQSKFIHQIFPDADMLETLDEEMKYFWAGLESAQSLVERLRTLPLFSDKQPFWHP